MIWGVNIAKLADIGKFWVGNVRFGGNVSRIIRRIQMLLSGFIGFCRTAKKKKRGTGCKPGYVVRLLSAGDAGHPGSAEPARTARHLSADDVTAAM